MSFQDTYFQDIGTSTKREDISAPSLQGESPKIETFDQSSYEARISKAASKITIICSMIFDDHSKLDLSSIHSGFQDDWSHDSESTNDLSLDNWVENSGFLDETFSILLSSISRFQPPLDLNSIYLYHNSTNSMT